MERSIGTDGVILRPLFTQADNERDDEDRGDSTLSLEDIMKDARIKRMLSN